MPRHLLLLLTGVLSSAGGWILGSLELHLSAVEVGFGRIGAFKAQQVAKVFAVLVDLRSEQCWRLDSG